MTPAEIDRVFGRARVRMMTGEHVEVFREEAREGEERRYTKRFLETASGDFRPWTEREWRILDRLGARGDAAVARVVRFFPADDTGMPRLQTRDAGPTVDQWASLVPLRRTAPVLPYVFGDCATWWALARQCLIAFEPLHALGFVHLDFKADNVCVPWKPSQAARPAAGQPMAPDFDGLALIDVAFSLLPGVDLPGALPLAREPGFEYQSPRLLEALDEGRRGELRPTRELDWRCDLYSMAAMLKRYLPPAASESAGATGWTSPRYDDARTLIFRLRDSHDRDLPQWRPHGQLIDFTGTRLDTPELADSLAAGWSLARDVAIAGVATPLTALTPMTRVAPMTLTVRRGRAARPPATPAVSAESPQRPAPIAVDSSWGMAPPCAATAITAVSASAWSFASLSAPPEEARYLPQRRRSARALPAAIAALSLVAVATPSFVGVPWSAPADQAPVVAEAPRVAAAVAPPPTEPAEVPAPAPAPAAAATDASPPAAAAEPVTTTVAAALDPPTPRATPAETSANPARTATRAAPKHPSAAAIKAPSAPAKKYADAARRPPPHAATIARYRSPPSPVQQDMAAVAARPSTLAQAAPAPAAAAPAADASARREPAATPTGPTEAVAADSVAKASPPPPVAAEPPPQRSVARASQGTESRGPLASFLALFRDRAGSPAPVEDRTAKRTETRPSAASRALAQSATDALARAAVVSSAAASSPPSPHAGPPPQAGPLAAVSMPLPSEPVARASAVSAPEIAAPERAAVAMPDAAPARGLPAARYIPAPPALERMTTPPGEPPGDDAKTLTAQARRLLVDTVPRVAAQAEPEVSRVLSAAAVAYHPSQARTVIDLANGAWSSESEWVAVAGTNPAYARRLHNEARRAAAAGSGIAETLDVELQAFGANPRDPDIAGYLALLHLKMVPSRPELARQLALHAIVNSGARRSTRAADWNTFAVASALVGRDGDATRGFLTEAALTSNVDRSCQSALSAYASYGEPLRTPVLALLQRMNAQGRAYAAPSCAWPAYWSAAARAGMSY